MITIAFNIREFILGITGKIFRPKKHPTSKKDQEKLDELLFPEIKSMNAGESTKKKKFKNRFIPVENEIRYLQKNEPKKKDDETIQ